MHNVIIYDLQTAAAIMVYKQITERGGIEQWNKEMKTSELAGVRCSQCFGCFLDDRSGSPFNTKRSARSTWLTPYAHTYLAVVMPTLNGILPL